VRREPIFNVPTSVLVTLIVLVAVHAVLWWWMAPEQADWVTLALAFIPARYAGFAAELPGGPLAAVTSFFTYQLVHADVTHLLVNAAWLLAFGSAVAMRIGMLRFFAFSLLSGACGALLFLLLRWGEAVPVIGASGAVSGMMAASMRFLFTSLGEADVEGFRDHRRRPALLSLVDTLSNGRILMVIGVWVIINFVMALAAPALTSAGGIAWQVHLGGFAFGLLTFGLFDRAPQQADEPVA
jgi:membrane associated rhomboid family serine protease